MAIMRLTDEERAALYKKEEDTSRVVSCPRCGKNLSYREIGNSYEIECPTPGCIKLVVRGL